MSTATNVAKSSSTESSFDPASEIEELRKRVYEQQIPQGLRDKVDRMLLRLTRQAQMGSYTKEFESVEHYVGWVERIPWGNYSKDNLNLEDAKADLNKHHYGLQHVKDMVLEYLAVMKLKMQNQTSAATEQKREADQSEAMKELKGNSANAPVLCFIGIQGVGKTSIAKSIASALDREFVRIALGAMGSATQIRGLTRTQPNAEPGQIIKALATAGTMNPVILLDEIDKTSSESGLRADLMAALLEILDPEQNSTFSDHYLDYPVDLSQCMFITTANNLGGVSAALLDRLEVIRFGSYNDEEKVQIAKDYMLPKVRKATGMTEQQLSFDADVWPLVVRPLGFDAGVRQLERTLTVLARKVARQLVEGKTAGVRVTKENFRQFIPEDIGVYS